MKELAAENYGKWNGLCYGLKIRKIMVQCNP